MACVGRGERRQLLPKRPPLSLHYWHQQLLAGRCALAGKVGGWRRSSSAPLVLLPSSANTTRSTFWCAILLHPLAPHCTLLHPFAPLAPPVSSCIQVSSVFICLVCFYLFCLVLSVLICLYLFCLLLSL